jgi:hypothetical protein
MEKLSRSSICFAASMCVFLSTFINIFGSLFLITNVFLRLCLADKKWLARKKYIGIWGLDSCLVTFVRLKKSSSGFFFFFFFNY